MAVKAFDNENLVNGLCAGSCNITGFTPSVTYVYDATAATVTVTNASTIPSGDTLKVVHLKVHDKAGDEVHGEMVIAAGGQGYTSAPTVSFTGGGGSGATATATVANGVVTGVTVTAAGTGYTSVPTVVFTGGGGTDAKATASLTSTTVTGVAMVTSGNTEVIDVSSLDRSKGLNLTATVLTVNHIAADGIATDIGAAGAVGSWDTQQNA